MVSELMIPREISFGEIYLPPLLVVASLALILAWITAKALNRFRWSRFFATPTLVFLAITTLYALVIGTFIIPV